MLCAFGHVVGVNGALEITFVNYELRCSSVVKPVEVHHIKSYFIPLITYGIGALELCSRAIGELAVC